MEKALNLLNYHLLQKYNPSFKNSKANILKIFTIEKLKLWLNTVSKEVKDFFTNKLKA